MCCQAAHDLSCWHTQSSYVATMAKCSVTEATSWLRKENEAKVLARVRERISTAAVLKDTTGATTGRQQAGQEPDGRPSCIHLFNRLSLERELFAMQERPLSPENVAGQTTCLATAPPMPLLRICHARRKRAKETKNRSYILRLEVVIIIGKYY